MFIVDASQTRAHLGSVYAVKAFRRFNVRVPLPSRLTDLAVLANNLRWVWHVPTQELFAAIDPERWASTGDPLRVLADVDQDLSLIHISEPTRPY